MVVFGLLNDGAHYQRDDSIETTQVLLLKMLLYSLNKMLVLCKSEKDQEET